MARTLGIPNDRVTLLDRCFSSFAKERFSAEFPGVRAIESGMFSFLESPTEKGFSLITAFGVGELLWEEDHMKTFISSLPKALEEKGLVYVYPYGGKDMKKFWQECGFKPILSPDEMLASPLIYLFNPRT